MSDSNSTPTVGDMIDHCKQLEAYIEQEMALVKDRLAPYQQAITTLNSAIREYLVANGAQNVKSAGGYTAYLTRPLSVKVVDRDAFLRYVVNEDHYEFLDARCLKEPVEKLLDENEERAKRGEPPVAPSSIGISAEPAIKCNIRRS